MILQEVILYITCSGPEDVPSPLLTASFFSRLIHQPLNRSAVRSAIFSYCQHLQSSVYKRATAQEAALPPLGTRLWQCRSNK